MDEADRLHFEKTAQWHDRLARYHTQQGSVWLWIAAAKRSETRARRVRESADLIAAGRRLEER